MKNFQKKNQLSDIAPVYKKEDSTKVKSYKRGSVLPTVSAIFCTMD